MQFANGFGSLRNQSIARDVNPTSSSGTIKPVIVPRGSAFAETALTASMEVGKVNVVAQYGNQQAEAAVQFTLEGGTLEIVADGKSSSTITIRVKDRNNIPVAFTDEKTIQLSTSLGTITGSVKLPAHATEVKVSLVSGTASGMAIVTGMMDHLRGETTVKIGSLEKRHCQRCGEEISLEAVICPKCKQSPTMLASSTKECPFCHEVLPKDAVYCNKCGRAQA